LVTTTLEPQDRELTRTGKLSERNSEPASRLFQRVVPVVSKLLSLVAKRDWDDARYLPAEGPAIICANHLSSLDPVVVGEYLAYHGRWPYFLAKAGLFKLPGLGWALRHVGQVPVYRGTIRAKDSLVAAVEHLESGRIVVIYPEGTTGKDPDEWPMMVRTGAARLALRTGAPVIPIGQWGANIICPDNGSPRNHPKLFPRQWVTVRMGPPVDLGDLLPQKASRDVVREASRRILAAITTQVELVRGEAAPQTLWNPRLNARVPRDEAVF
jgi:1-acyl-sn-glycerol-3-phosphate acyltransferase